MYSVNHTRPYTWVLSLPHITPRPYCSPAPSHLQHLPCDHGTPQHVGAQHFLLFLSAPTAPPPLHPPAAPPLPTVSATPNPPPLPPGPPNHKSPFYASSTRYTHPPTCSTSRVTIAPPNTLVLSISSQAEVAPANREALLRDSPALLTRTSIPAPGQRLTTILYNTQQYNTCQRGSTVRGVEDGDKWSYTVFHGLRTVRLSSREAEGGGGPKEEDHSPLCHAPPYQAVSHHTPHTRHSPGQCRHLWFLGHVTHHGQEVHGCHPHRG